MLRYISVVLQAIEDKEEVNSSDVKTDDENDTSALSSTEDQSDSKSNTVYWENFTLFYFCTFYPLTWDQILNFANLVIYKELCKKIGE